MLVTGGVITVGGTGVIIGVTAGGLSDAFLLGMAGAIAVACVSAFIGGIRWLWNLDQRMTELAVQLAATRNAVTVIEAELTANDGASVKDAIGRIDRRARSLAVSLGDEDYDDSAD